MKRILFYSLLALIFVDCSSQEKPKSFKVMAWNILHGANDIDNGPQNAIQIIKEINPDVILMIETYGSGKMIADSLGLNFHLIAPMGTALNDKSINLSIYSKFPFGERIDTDFPFYLGGREILINGQKIRFLTNWFHYQPWSNEPEKMDMTTKELLEWERTETRYPMIQKILPYLKKYAAEADSIPLIFGGDMNSPSHLDWGSETKHIHNGLEVPWYSTKVIEDIGLIDSYRETNDDPIIYPGITWDTKEIKDEHRIDYIFYKGAKLKAVASKSYKAFLDEPISIHGNTIKYPSDHGFVVTIFEY